MRWMHMSKVKKNKRYRVNRQGQRTGADPLYKDLLFPILGVLCVLPFVVRLEIYDTGYDRYVWYVSENGWSTDLFSLAKSRLFVLLAIVMAVILLLRWLFFRNSMRFGKELFFLAGYGICVVLSSLLSKYKIAAVRGNLESFENVFVLLGYVVLAFYVYETVQREEDYRLIWRGFLVAFILLAFVGILQIFNIRLLDQDWIQRLIMREEDYEVLGGRQEYIFIGRYVFSTLANPNYAGVWFSMAFVLLFAMSWTETKRRKRIGLTLLTILALVLMWFTYSRTALVSSAAGLCCVVYRRKLEEDRITGSESFRVKELIRAAVILAAAAAGLLILDGLTGFHFLSRLKDSGHQEPLEKILTLPEGVLVRYDGREYVISMQEGRLLVRADGKTANDPLLTDDGSQASAPSTEKETSASGYEDGLLKDGIFYISAKDQVKAYPDERLVPEGFSLEAAGQRMDFVREDDTWWYLTKLGEKDQMAEIPKVSFGGLEYLGSSRLYIWSRTLPLAGKYILAGSGPDSFPEVFPQNDYAGKAVYADRAERVIESAHNAYLNQWIQTGGLSLVCLLAFYFSLVRKFRQKRRKMAETQRCGRTMEADLANPFVNRLQAGAMGAFLCFLTASLFIDSTVQTAPFFWILAGLIM